MSFNLLIAVFCILYCSVGFSETTKSAPLRIDTSLENPSPELLAQYPALAPIYRDRYFPRVSQFARDEDMVDRFRNADRFGSEEWQKLRDEEKGEYIMSVYEALIKLHGYDYSPRIMTCKTYRESAFKPQIGAYTSTAIGLSQVTQETTVDLVDRFGFEPKLFGLTGVTGAEYYEALKNSMVAQMEAGLGVIYMKSQDFGKTKIKSILEKYYATSSDEENEHYAQTIYDCADCIKQNENKVLQKCLDKAKVVRE
jgi:hypothetical protein